MSVQEQIDRLVAQRAAQWFEVYRTGQQEHYPVVAWLTESPQHVREFLEIASRFAETRAALRSGAFSVDALLQRVAPESRKLLPLCVAAPTKTKAPPLRWRWATAVALPLLITVLALGFSTEWLWQWQYFETQVGEQRVIQLSDGSVLTLNTQSLAAVRLSRAQRDVRLVHGEALFKVARDKTRPFLVHTRRATVRATGTQFSVYAKPDGSTTVAVLEGRVEISVPQVMQSHTAGAKPISLVGNQSVRVASTGVIQRDVQTNISNAIAWRQRRLVFDRALLEDMVAEFNRYNRARRLRLANVPPGAYHFTGSFDADDPRSLALLLSREPELFVTEEQNGEIWIQGRNNLR